MNMFVYFRFPFNVIMFFIKSDDIGNKVGTKYFYLNVTFIFLLIIQLPIAIWQLHIYGCFILSQQYIIRANIQNDCCLRVYKKLNIIRLKQHSSNYKYNANQVVSVWGNIVSSTSGPLNFYFPRRGTLEILLYKYNSPAGAQRSWQRRGRSCCNEPGFESNCCRVVASISQA